MLSKKFTIPVLCLASALTASGAGTARFNVASGDWETAGNWATVSGTPSLPPSAADVLSLSRVGGASVTLAGSYSVAGFSLTSATILTGVSSLRTLSVTAGNNFSLSTLTLDQVKISQTGGTLALSAGLTLQNGASWESSATTTFNSASAFSISSGGGSGNAFSILSGGTGTLSGGSQTVTVASGVAFSSAGIFNANRGTMDVQSTSATLSGTVSFGTEDAVFKNSGTMTVGALTVGTLTGNTGTDFFENSGTMNLGAGGAVSFNLPTGAGTSYTVLNSGGGTMNLNSGNTITFSQVFQQTGASTLSLNSPTLVLNSNMNIGAGSVIGSLAAANVSGGGDATFASGSGLSPGSAGVGNVGTIAFPDALTLSTGSTLTIDVNSNVSADRVQAAGVANITGSSLVVRRNATITDGTVFTILSGASVTGTFSGLAEGATVGTSFVINYGTVQANAVTLTAVPEPGFYACTFGLGLAGFAVWRSNRRRA